MALLGPAFVVSPGLLQKIYAARDDRAVRLGVGLNALVLLVFAAVPPLLGMMARSVYPNLASHDLALPMLLTDALPAWIGALGLAALFSAEVSSADTILFMLATSWSHDLYHRFVMPSSSEAQLLRVARGAAIVGGIMGTALAVAAGSIAEALMFFYAVLTVSLFVPIMAGLYQRRIESPDVLAGMATGLVTLFGVHVGTAGQGVVGLTPVMVGLGAAVLGCTGVAVLRPR